MNIKTRYGQTLIDLALQYYGCYEGLFILLEDNPTINSIDEVPQPGTILLIRDSVPALTDNNVSVVAEINKRSLTFNSSIAADEITTLPYIEAGYWSSTYTE